MKYLTLYRHWFNAIGSTQNLFTWDEICTDLDIDDYSEDLEKIILTVDHVRYDDASGNRISPLWCAKDKTVSLDMRGMVFEGKERRASNG